MDRAQAGQFAMEAIDFVASHFEGQQVTLGNMILVTEIRVQDEDGDVSNVMYFSDDSSSINQIGMLTVALESAKER